MNSNSRRLLIADDHEAIRQGVRGFIEGRPGWQVVAEAADGERALALARETKPDIAILDYSLPVLNGLELTRTIRRELPATEVLIYTMHDREDVVVEALQAGAKGYVLKSDTQRDLIAAIESLALRRPYLSSAIPESLLDRVSTARGRRASPTLTPRERAVVQLIAEGNINKEIASILGISVKTVETHRAAAMHKLNLRTTAELVRFAVRNNIVEA